MHEANSLKIAMEQKILKGLLVVLLVIAMPWADESCALRIDGHFTYGVHDIPPADPDQFARFVREVHGEALTSPSWSVADSRIVE